METGKKEKINLKSDDSVVLNESAEGPAAEVCAEEVLVELPSSRLNVSNSMASSVSDQEKNFDVSFVKIYAVEVG